MWCSNKGLGFEVRFFEVLSPVLPLPNCNIWNRSLHPSKFQLSTLSGWVSQRIAADNVYEKSVLI